MSLHICPKCKHKGFLWIDHGEPYIITTWNCIECGYHAIEDQYLERQCSNCGEKTQAQLKDDENKYWWCANCNIITYDV